MLDEKRERKREGKGEEHITFACLMSEQARKCTSEIDQLKPLSSWDCSHWTTWTNLSLWNYNRGKIKIRRQWLRGNYLWLALEEDVTPLSPCAPHPFMEGHWLTWWASKLSSCLSFTRKGAASIRLAFWKSAFYCAAVMKYRKDCRSMWKHPCQWRGPQIFWRSQPCSWLQRCQSGFGISCASGENMYFWGIVEFFHKMFDHLSSPLQILIQWTAGSACSLVQNSLCWGELWKDNW